MELVSSGFASVVVSGVFWGYVTMDGVGCLICRIWFVRRGVALHFHLGGGCFYTGLY